MEILFGVIVIDAFMANIIICGPFPIDGVFSSDGYWLLCSYIPMDCEDTKKRNMSREAQQGSNYSWEVIAC